jgi:long-chain acyl-CoA synthetase
METPVPEKKRLTTLVDSFYRHEKEQPDKIYLRQPVGDGFTDYSWADVGQQARRLATFLNSQGLPPQSNIGLIAKNCAHWLIADIGIMLSGHVSVPLYPTLTADQLAQVLDHSGCAVLLVGKLDNWAAMKPGVPTAIRCVSLPGAAPDADLESWDEMMAQHPPMTESPRPDPDDLYTIVYTSGTTGTPKGVMVDYRAMAEAIEDTRASVRHDVGPLARFFSYLPLCHIAERNVVESTSLCTGGTVYFVESMETFSKNLAAARPTHFLAVPRIWTKFQQGVLGKMPQQKLDRLLRIPVVSGLVKRKIRQGLGLNDAVFILTGAAPMPTSLIMWFRRLDIIIQEAYGMTENLGAVSLMPRQKIKDGTVGKIYPGMDVQIDPQTGEVQTRGGWLMRGYYRAPELTEQTLQDGWLLTGDVGEVDAEGYLKITGRVKEMYKTAKGEYVSPAQIEFGFADNTFIEQICVVGQFLPQPIALVVLSELGQRAGRDAVATSLAETLATLNPRLYGYERVRKLVVMPDAWTVENNCLTPTMKTKRNVIEGRFEPLFETWYNAPETVIWA